MAGRMKKTFAPIVSVLAASVFSAFALAQSPAMMPSNPQAANQGHNAPNPSTAAAFAPSEIAVAPSGPATGRPSRRLEGSSLSAITGSKRRSPEGLNLPHLCFQPGIGWTAITEPDFALYADTKQNPSDADKHDAGNSQQGDRGLNAANKLAKLGECPQTALAQTGLGDTNDASNQMDSSIDFKSSLLTQQPEQTTYGGIQSLLADNSVSGAENSPLVKPSIELPDGPKSKGSYDSTDPSAALEQLKALRHRSYISPVKLRRMSRNMQDLQTRLELRQMNTEVQKRKSKQTPQDQKASTGSGKAANHKALNSHDLLARKAACDQKGNASKSKLCALLKH